VIPDDWTIEEQKAALDELRAVMFREPRWFPFARRGMVVCGVLGLFLCALGETSVHTPGLVYAMAGLFTGVAWQAQQTRRFEENWFCMAQMDRNILLRMALEERARAKGQAHG
jgi:hypothetical protein